MQSLKFTRMHVLLSSIPCYTRNTLNLYKVNLAILLGNDIKFTPFSQIISFQYPIPMFLKKHTSHILADITDTALIGLHIHKEVFICNSFT